MWVDFRKVTGCLDFICSVMSLLEWDLGQHAINGLRSISAAKCTTFTLNERYRDNKNPRVRFCGQVSLPDPTNNSINGLIFRTLCISEWWTRDCGS